jgi:hypothetical protein
VADAEVGKGLGNVVRDAHEKMLLFRREGLLCLILRHTPYWVLLFL